MEYTEIVEFLKLQNLNFDVVSNALTVTFIIWLIFYWTKHIFKVNRFINSTLVLVDEYLQNTKVDNSYFTDILESRILMYCTPWISNFDNYILDNDKVEELIEFKDKENEIQVELERDGEYICPWCDGEEFGPIYFETERIYTVQCTKCGAMTPFMDTADECFDLLKIYPEDTEE